VTPWNLSLWTHDPGSGVTLLLRLGTTVSTVGWNVLRLYPFGVLFLENISALYYGYLPMYDLFRCVFIYI
jgi:hypothetical protein